MKTKYNIGLDIGTSSVGWAVVEDGTQKIVKKGKKALWGVRLFDEGTTAEARRAFRSTRRRYDRRRKRIRLLQEEFREEIEKVDKNFFQKLEESKYCSDDDENKTIKISDEENKLIREYNKKYPTIYHLRKRLVSDDTKEDIRLVYLAIHHIIKYRGNFLYENTSFNVDNLDLEESLVSVFESFVNLVPEVQITDDFRNTIGIKDIADACLLSSKNDVKEDVKLLLKPINKDFAGEFSKLVVGNKFNLRKLFNDDSLKSFDNNSKDLELSFKDSTYDDNYDSYVDSLEDRIEVVDALRNLYNIIFLKRLFKGRKTSSISSLMVDNYNQHKEDLQLLKNIFKDNLELKKKLLKSKKNNKVEKCLYDKYVSNEITIEEFTNSLSKLLEKINYKFDDETQKRFVNLEFLPKITSVDNGKYPYQLNEKELISIIENQGKYYPFLLEKTNYKGNDIYKIDNLLKFRIPYYVGPLVSSDKSEFAWMERKIDNVKITPYNFDDVIDKEKTAELFIKRMISHCTYLLDEYALPNNSILYSQFKVLNELKQIRINGNKLELKQIQKIIDNFFKKTKGSITESKFVNYICSDKDFEMYANDIKITGYSADKKFANNMQSYYDFFSEEGIFAGTNYDISDAEIIIEWITIFNDKDILEKKVRDNYPNLDNNKIKSILNKKYTGWGRLSKKLLTEKYYVSKETGIKKSIMDLMYETDENFMQIINNDSYKFQKMIDEYNEIKNVKKINYELVNKLATSPKTKKGIYQALKIVEELVDYMGYKPSNIMIEMAREDGKKVRKDDKKSYLKNIYEGNSNSIVNYYKLYDELKNREITDEKLYLYFIQEGKCLYSGRPIDIENLEECEVDHIIPRTLIKDNSIDNKALVYRECNQEKAAEYVLPYKYRKNNKEWWARLKKIGLISPKKFYNLTRDKYSDEDIKGFINRQLVETRQITKHVANILNTFYKNTNVIYLKANLSHNYRERYELYKFRDINDYHHAHDAYLAAVLGEYKEKYMNRDINFDMVKELNNRIREAGKKDILKYGFVINSLDEIANDIVLDISSNLCDKYTGEVFDAKRFNKIVEDTLYRNDILVSRKVEIRTGQFYKETIFPKGEGTVSLKENMPVEKYGGYKNVESSYMCLVKFGEKKKIIGLPMKIVVKSKNDNLAIDKFIRNHLNLDNNEEYSLIKAKISFEQEMIYKGQNVYIKGFSERSGLCEISNARQLKIKKENQIKWAKALDYIINGKTNEEKIKEADKYADDILLFLLTLDKDYPLFANAIINIKNKLNYKDCTLDEKIIIIKELFKLYKCNSSNADLSQFSLSNRIGRLSGNNITSGILIFKDITGIREIKYEF